ncbi:Vesicle transport v-SNARE protein [Tritrichomonas foetus]|uniref:Vesicle transport v-SNARE protein n=1 Tax=Tritrichomonas foetus TaxID=1144522 RepID=A0A1J4KSN5_9EUKA|nr:Vesicle transport v-SNARE protein [Tritrichomonas foetus]|eukprot:OHT12812.1 Vesicle transport v-SNARE protein [Tritrichomonas foetus]
MSQTFIRNLEIAQGLDSAIGNEINRLNSAPIIEHAQIIHNIQTQLNDLNLKIGNLRGQLNTLDRDEREMYAEDLRDIDNNMAGYRSQVNVKQQALDSQRTQVQHDRNMQKGEEIVNNLDKALTIGNDTIQTQQNTMNTLEQDQQHFNRIEENLSVVETEAKIGESRAKRMFMRMVCNRILWWTIVVVLFAFLIFSLVWKLKPEKGSE